MSEGCEIVLWIIAVFVSFMAIPILIRFSLWRDKQKEESRKYEIHPK
jgi:membrane protein YdbS with pleckstrin-like domain